MTKKCHIDWEVFLIWLNVGLWDSAFWIWLFFAVKSILRILQ